MDRAKWLDGLRGIAAAVVAFDNLLMGEVLYPFRSFWSHPPTQNRHWIQLPPFRIVFSAHAMVALFFVISGYAISLNLLRGREHQHKHQHPDADQPQESNLYSRVSAAATRRLFRLYLPVLAIVGISQFLYFINLYHGQFDDMAVYPWAAPWRHLGYLLGYVADIVNPLALQYSNRRLNAQLWTMPIELRGSAIVYLLIIVMATWRPRPKSIALGVLSAYFLWFGMWDIFAFVAGLWLAEVKTTEEAPLDDDEKDEPLLPSSSSSSAASPALQSRFIQPFRVLNLLLFLLGFYLLCLPDDAFIPRGYRFLLPLQPTRWANSINWQTVHFSWKSVGAVLIVYSINNSPALKHILAESSILQYLGKISFSLYLVHQSVYQLWREPVQKHIWRATAGYPYPGPELAVREPFAWAITWIGSVMVLGPVLIFVADEFTRNVDVRCMAAAREVERWLVKPN